jgi:hypothetical protein
VSAASYEDARATIAGALANTPADMCITVLGAWSELRADRRAPLDDGLVDLRLIHESFVHDARVRLVESIPPTSAPIPFRFCLPIGWVPRAGAMYQLLRILEDKALGVMILGLPGRLEARLERTSAVARAQHLRKDGEKLDDVVFEVFGTATIQDAAWAFAPAADPSRGTSISPRKVLARCRREAARLTNRRREHR